MHRPVDSRIGFRCEPGERQLVEMLEALEAAVAHEEVVLHVAHHPLVFSFGPCPVRPARSRPETIVPREIHEALVESYAVADSMLDHRALLIVDEHLLSRSTEVLEGADDPFVRVPASSLSVAQTWN